MQIRVRAIVTVVPVKFPDRVEVQALLLDAEDRTTDTGLIYAPEPWHVWRARFELSASALDDAELTLARDEAAQLGVLLMHLPPDLSGRDFVIQPC
jgi:3',5'-cyclic AMP phosphodiesterase CpdA